MASCGHPKYAEYARDIGDAGRALHAKIGDILEFANIEAGPLSPDRRGGGPGRRWRAPASTNIRAAPSRAASRCRSPSASRAWCAPMPRGAPHPVQPADQCPGLYGEGGIVRADVRFEEGAGVLTLSDSGTRFLRRRAEPGRQAFRRFDRAGTVTGAGLGLAIAMELARRMGGRDAAGRPKARAAAPPWKCGCPGYDPAGIYLLLTMVNQVSRRKGDGRCFGDLPRWPADGGLMAVAPALGARRPPTRSSATIPRPGNALPRRAAARRPCRRQPERPGDRFPAAGGRRGVRPPARRPAAMDLDGLCQFRQWRDPLAPPRHLPDPRRARRLLAAHRAARRPRAQHRWRRPHRRCAAAHARPYRRRLCPPPQYPAPALYAAGRQAGFHTYGEYAAAARL